MKIQEAKEHLIYAAALFVLTVVFLNTWLNPNIHTLGDLVEFYYPRAEMLRQSISDYNDIMPLWTPYIFAGDPLFLKSSFLNILYLPGPLLFLTNPLGALKWTIVIDMFLAGLFMYFFMLYLIKKPKFAFLSALVYMLNGYFLYTTVYAEWVDFANAYPFIPLVMLFTIKAFKEKNAIENSIFAGISLGIMLIASSGTVFLYATLILLVYFAMSIVGRKAVNRIIKAAVIGTIILAVFFGVSAFKLLPNFEYQKDYGVRERLTWEDASGRRVMANEFFREIVEPSFPKFSQQPSSKIGIAAFLLALFAIYKMPKNRNTIFFVILIIMALLMVTGSFLLQLLWKYYPGWGGMRYANRAFILLVFSASCLAGFGAAAFLEWIKSKYKSARAEHIAYFSIIILIIADLAIFGVGGAGNLSTQPQNLQTAIDSNEAMNYLSKQEGTFRIHTYETRGIDWGTEFYATPLKLETLYGYDSNWYPEYLNRFLAFSSSNPAKFWGIMNVKYVTSQTPLNTTGFKFVNKLNDCKICFPEQPAIQKAWGPYLYENMEFMPRAYLINNSILIVGKESDAKNIMYAIMNEEAFDPRKTALILGREKVDDYSIEELNKFNNIVLLQGSVSDANKLQSYNGELLPNILKGETSFSLLQLKEVLRKGKMEEIPDEDIKEINFDKKIIKTRNYKGYLVLSEKYALFRGWNAKSEKGKKELLLTNGVIAAVYLDNDEKIEFEYSPASFRIGSVITIITIVLLLGLFIYKKTKLKKTAKGQE